MDEKRENVAQMPTEQVKPPLASHVEKPLPSKAVSSEGSAAPAFQAPAAHSVSVPPDGGKVERTSSWFAHMWNWFLSA